MDPNMPEGSFSLLNEIVTGLREFDARDSIYDSDYGFVYRREMIVAYVSMDQIDGYLAMYGGKKL